MDSESNKDVESAPSSVTNFLQNARLTTINEVAEEMETQPPGQIIPEFLDTGENLTAHEIIEFPTVTRTDIITTDTITTAKTQPNPKTPMREVDQTINQDYQQFLRFQAWAQQGQPGPAALHGPPGPVAQQGPYLQPSPSPQHYFQPTPFLQQGAYLQPALLLAHMDNLAHMHPRYIMDHRDQ